MLLSIHQMKWNIHQESGIDWSLLRICLHVMCVNINISIYTDLVSLIGKQGVLCTTLKSHFNGSNLFAVYINRGIIVVNY